MSNTPRIDRFRKAKEAADKNALAILTEFAVKAARKNKVRFVGSAGYPSYKYVVVVKPFGGGVFLQKAEQTGVNMSWVLLPEYKEVSPAFPPEIKYYLAPHVTKFFDYNVATQKFEEM